MTGTPRAPKFAIETRSLANLLAGVKKTQEDWLTAKANSAGLLSIGDAVMLAYGYAQGTQLQTYKSPLLINRFILDIDTHIAKFYADKNYAAASWGGTFHTTADALLAIWDDVKSRFDEMIEVGAGAPVKRREAWAKALRYGMDVERKARRTITNQILEANIGIYRANRALMLLDPSSALSEAAARRYIDEAAGLLPFSGADLDLVEGGSAWPFGRNYYVINPKGTTREPGWVGSDYGDVVFYFHWFWELTGDSRFKDQALKVAQARAMTTYFSGDGNGLAGMRIVDAINTRNDYFPGRIRYADFPFAVATRDPALLGYVQQQIDEGQFWVEHWRDLDFKFLDQWKSFAALPRSNVKLPYTPGQPDAAWADEDDHIVTVKRGEEFLALNMFHRSSSIDGHVRVFMQSPQGVRHADIQADDTAYASSGRYVTGDGLVDSILTLPPDNPVSANRGVRTMLSLGENGDCEAAQCAGRPRASTVRFGRYLIGMNASDRLSYAMKLPGNFSGGVDLISGKSYASPLSLPPRTTVVFYLDKLPQGETPSRPTFATAAAGNAAVTLAWDAPARASAFSVLRASTAGGAYTVVASGLTTPNYTDLDVSNGREYHYTIVGVNDVGTGGASSELSVTPADTGLPSPWAGVEATVRTLKGTVTFAGGTLTLKTSSYHLMADTFKRDDDAFFVYRPWAGDGSVVARVTAATKPTNGGSQSALFMRGSLATNAPGAALHWTSSNKVTLGWRTTPGGATVSGPVLEGCTLPCWLKLTRSGRRVSGSASSDGVTWRQVGEVEVYGLTDTSYVGPAATGNYNGGLATSVFDQIAVTR